MNKLTLQELQRKVVRSMNQFKEGNFPFVKMLARLMKEVGEGSTEVQPLYGHETKKQANDSVLAIKHGDVLLSTSCLATTRPIHLSKALLQVLHKVEIRDSTRWTRKEERND